jgi:hypothetical protein
MKMTFWLSQAEAALAQVVDAVECPRIVSTDLNSLWFLAEWH